MIKGINFFSSRMLAVWIGFSLFILHCCPVFAAKTPADDMLKQAEVLYQELVKAEEQIKDAETARKALKMANQAAKLTRKLATEAWKNGKTRPAKQAVQLTDEIAYITSEILLKLFRFISTSERSPLFRTAWDSLYQMSRTVRISAELAEIRGDEQLAASVISASGRIGAVNHQLSQMARENEGVVLSPKAVMAAGEHIQTLSLLSSVIISSGNSALAKSASEAAKVSTQTISSAAGIARETDNSRLARVVAREAQNTRKTLTGVKDLAVEKTRTGSAPDIVKTAQTLADGLEPLIRINQEAMGLAQRSVPAVSPPSDAKPVSPEIGQPETFQWQEPALSNSNQVASPI